MEILEYFGIPNGVGLILFEDFTEFLTVQGIGNPGASSFHRYALRTPTNMRCMMMHERFMSG